MAGLTQRTTATVAANGTNSSSASKQQQQQPILDTTITTTYNGTSANKDSTSGTATVPTAANSKGKSLKERSQIPYSFYVTFGTILSLQYGGGLYTYTTLQSWYQSLLQSIYTMIDLLHYSRTVFASLLSSFIRTTGTTVLSNNNSTTNIPQITTMEYIFVVTLWIVVILPLLYVFFIAPYRAGFWTGRKSTRHVFHRYMGLCYLIHYVLAWIEFFNHTSTSKTSYLCHIIAVMGKGFLYFVYNIYKLYFC
jgi:hypothetical protein